MKSFSRRGPLTGKTQTFFVTSTGHAIGADIPPLEVQQAASRIRRANSEQPAKRQSTTHAVNLAALARMQAAKQQANLRQPSAAKAGQSIPSLADLTKGLKTSDPAIPLALAASQEQTMTTAAQTTTDLFQQGKHHYENRDFAQAETAFTQLAQNPTSRPMAFYGLGVLNYSQGKLDVAEDNLKKCVQSTQDGNLSADATHYLGQVALRRRDISRSIELHRAVLRTKPEHFGSARQLDALERYILDYAKSLYRGKRLTDSKKAYKSILSSQNYKAAGYYGLGVIEYQSGNSKAAATNFNACLDLHPKHANAWFYLARIAEHDRQSRQKARDLYEKVFQINPNHIGALGALKRLDEPVKVKRDPVKKVSDATQKPSGERRRKKVTNG